MALHRLDPGVTPRRLLDHFRLLYEGRPLGWVLGDMDGAASEEGAAGSAGAELCEGHSYRHSAYLVPGSEAAGQSRIEYPGHVGLHAQMQRKALSATSLTTLYP